MNDSVRFLSSNPHILSMPIKRSIYRQIETARRSLLVGLGVQLVTIPILHAQSSETGAPAEMKKQVVIGSNIPTAEMETAQPGEVYSRAKIDQMGVTTVNDLLQRLPQIGAGGINGANNGFGFAPGAAAVSLRGLGLNATLVLLNGRRVAPYGMANDGTISFVDLNALPLEAIDSVEVLTAGNSAVYGADAIAGVINIKTKRSYRGGELRVFYGNTVHQDYGTAKGSITYGGGNDTTDFMVVADYYHQNDLYNRDRTYSSFSDHTPLGGINNGSSFAFPGRFAVPLNAPGLIGTPFYDASSSDTANLVPPLNTNGKAKPGDYHYFTDADRYDRTKYIQSLPKSERKGLYSTLNHRLFEDRLQAFAEFSYRHQEEHVATNPFGLDLFGSANGAGIPVGTTVVDKGVTILGEQLTIPATNPHNPFGADITDGRIRMFETGFSGTDTKTDTIRFVGGLRGEINDHFNYETAVLYNRARTDSSGALQFNLNEIQAALNDPNPATALNLFTGPDSHNNPATLSKLTINPQRISITDLLSWDARANGNLFQLPGGDVAYAAGLEYRTERYSDDPDSTLVGQGLPGVTLVHDSGSRDVASTYVETRIPITGKDWHVLPFYRVNLTAAGRVEHYSDAGIAAVPTIGIEWRPINEDILLRASYSENFRPASLQQLFNHPLEAGTERFTDPLRGTTESVYIKSGGNPHLKPETATQWTAGMVWSPSQVKNLRTSVDWLQVSRSNEIGSAYDFFGPEYLANQPDHSTRRVYEGDAAFLRENPTLPLPQIDPSTGLRAGQLQALNDNYSNIGSTVADYIDTRLTYSIPTRQAGTWTFDASASYLLSFRVLDPASGTYLRQAGRESYGDGDGLPRWRATSSLTWEYQKLQASAFANYIGKLGYDNPASGDPATVASFLTFDVQASYRLPWDCKVTAGINNVMDANPPLDLSPNFANVAYSYRLHSPLGRYYYFELSKKF